MKNCNRTITTTTTRTIKSKWHLNTISAHTHTHVVLTRIFRCSNILAVDVMWTISKLANKEILKCLQSHNIKKSLHNLKKSTSRFCWMKKGKHWCSNKVIKWKSYSKHGTRWREENNNKKKYIWQMLYQTKVI